MSDGVEHIGKSAIIWSYISTFFSFGAGAILMPFILNKMSAEMVGIWNVFMSITMLVALLDFGFQPTFARTISYIFSGAKTLRKEGVEIVDTSHQEVDYGLLSGTIHSMRTFYRWVALITLVLLLTIGTGYMYYILQSFTGEKIEVWIAWVILIIINCYNLYTMYYDALMLGKGYVKRQQQIGLVAHVSYITVGITLIMLGYGLIAIVLSQLIAVIIRRIGARRVFFTPEMRRSISSSIPVATKPIWQAIMPNAVKMGLTNLGGFLVTQSGVLIGTAVLPLMDMAMYGITLRIVEIIARCATVPYVSYMPKMAQYRTENNLPQLRHLFELCEGAMFIVTLLGSLCLIFLGDWALAIIHSKTMLLPISMIVMMCIGWLLEKNHVVAAGFLLADNKIPFFIPSLVAGGVTILLIVLFLYGFQWGVWGLILAPILAQVVYQNWKWPLMVVKELYGISK